LPRPESTKRKLRLAGGRIRLGMVGGGEGAFIGAVHRIATRVDDHFQFVAGALSSTPEKALRSGKAPGLDPNRTYSDYAAMARRESELPDGIDQGRIAQQGSPVELCRRHATRFVAGFTGEATVVIGDVTRVSDIDATVRLCGHGSKAGAVANGGCPW
jgi:hypothetical protein